VVYDISMETFIIVLTVVAGFAMVTLGVLFSLLRVFAWMGYGLADANDVEITDKRKSDNE
jgi:hypothetical protein